jgi:uncharacterized integral membrane protein
MRYLVVILILVVSIVMVIFGAQNTQTVKVQFFTYNSGDVSLSLLIVLAALGGATLTALVSIFNGIQSSMRERSLRRKLEQRNRELEQKVASLEKNYNTARIALQAQARLASEQRSSSSK